MGVIVKTRFLDTGTYQGKGENITVSADSMGNLTIIENKGSSSFKYAGVIGAELKGTPFDLSKTYNKTQSLIYTISDSDSMFLLRYPLTKSTLNIDAWPVLSPNNYITNGNFEVGYDLAPENNVSQIQKINDAYAVAWGSSCETPDFYKTKTNCYGGFRVMGVNFEVLRNQLNKPLEEGVTYCLQFKLKLKNENSYAFNGISVAVSKDLKFFNNSDEGRKLGIVLQSHPNIVLGCRESWMTISGTFEAQGGEKYLYISNFTDANQLKVFKADSLASDYISEIYYMIDDVVLIALDDNQNCPCNVKGCELDTMPKVPVNTEVDIYNKPEVGQKIILNNIQFESGKSTLLPESFDQLDSLVELLLKYPSMKVEISGFTDNQGKAKDNLILSQ
ncbi:MAG: OmpA family protein, partial [Bacteroidia bacterium]|nr:OmpA family protein [Bacteroidia bacterium]